MYSRPTTYILKYIIFTAPKIPPIAPLHGVTEHQSWTKYGLWFHSRLWSSILNRWFSKPSLRACILESSLILSLFLAFHLEMFYISLCCVSSFWTQIIGKWYHLTCQFLLLFLFFGSYRDNHCLEQCLKWFTPSFLPVCLRISNPTFNCLAHFKLLFEPSIK